MGHVVGPARPTGPPDATGPNAEPDKVIRRVRLEVLVCIRPAGTPLATDAELRAAGIDDLEVQRMPFGSNPSWISSRATACTAAAECSPDAVSCNASDDRADSTSDHPRAASASATTAVGRSRNGRRTGREAPVSARPVRDHHFEAIEQGLQGDLELFGGMVLGQLGFQVLESRIL